MSLYLFVFPVAICAHVRCHASTSFPIVFDECIFINLQFVIQSSNDAGDGVDDDLFSGRCDIKFIFILFFFSLSFVNVIVANKAKIASREMRNFMEERETP